MPGPAYPLTLLGAEAGATALAALVRRPFVAHEAASLDEHANTHELPLALES